MISQAASSSNRKVGSPPAAKIDNVLVTDQLVKIYGGRSVVDGISINVKAGEIVGLLGPNGAGQDDELLHDCRSGSAKQRPRHFPGPRRDKLSDA